MDPFAHLNNVRIPTGRPRRPISPARQPSRRPPSMRDGLGSLLVDLSPSYVLEALLATSPLSQPLSRKGKYLEKDPQKFVNAAAAQASSAERMWGIKAARFAKKVLEWQEEMTGWKWSEGSNESGNGFLLRFQDPSTPDHQRKVEFIQDELSKLEVGELKDFVRGAHAHSRMDAFSRAGEYEVLDDFTALVTATIVQALPRLAQLNALLNVWTTRFVILRRVPDFLKDMATCNDTMLSAHLAIQTPSSPNVRSAAIFSDKRFHDLKAILQDQIARLAPQLDMMLDLLEGSSDTLPDTWIDNMDRLENEYGSWVVQAQQVVLNNQIDAQHARTRVDFTLDDYAEGIESKLEAREPAITPKSSLNNFDRTRARYTPPVSGASSLRGNKDASSGMESDATHTKIAEQFYQLDQGDKNVPIGQRSLDSVDAESLQDQSASMTSETSSTMSSPLISHAEVATNLGSPIVVTSPMPGRRSMGFPPISTRPSKEIPANDPSVRRSWHGLPSSVTFKPEQRRRSSTLNIEEMRPPDGYSPPNGVNVVKSSPEYARPRSASIQSYEVVPRHGVRTIQIKRSQSYPIPDPSQKADQADVDKSSQKGIIAGAQVTISDFPPTYTRASTSQSGRDVPTCDGLAADMQRDYSYRFTDYDEFPKQGIRGKPSTEQVVPERDLAERLKTAPLRSLNAGRLEQQISSILQSIPADIRLLSDNDVQVKKTPSSLDVRKSSATRRVSLPRIIRSKTSTPTSSATLAPATQTALGDSDIKIYHLHRPDRSAPIKLHVRLVGGINERVMVRVGGGWADLEEYLKEYAYHHGKRSVSDGRFSIRGVPFKARSPPVTELKASVVDRSGSSSPTSNANAMKFSRQNTSPASIRSPPKTPQSALDGMDADSVSPSVGLAGPRTKKIDISPRKQAWVEGVLRQARRASAGDWKKDRGKDNESNIGDLGKVGGVKRVFFRDRQERL